MAVTAGVAGAVGGAMIIGGTAAAIKSMKEKTKPRKVNYGGSADALQGYREMAGQGIDKGAVGVAGAIQGNEQASRYVSGAVDSRGYINENSIVGRGLAIADSAKEVQDPYASREAMGLLQGYQPGAVSAAQQQAVLDQNARANLAAAQSGGAMARRAAINANAMAGVQSASDLAVLRAQEEQAYQQALVQQANVDRDAQLGAEAQAENIRMGRLGLGTGLVTQGNAQVMAANNAQIQAGLTQEKAYLDQLQSTNTTQMQADLDHERRRQADRQRRAQNLWGLGASLIGGGAKIAAGAGDGYAAAAQKQGQ